MSLFFKKATILLFHAKLHVVLTGINSGASAQLAGYLNSLELFDFFFVNLTICIASKIEFKNQKTKKQRSDKCKTGEQILLP